MRIDEKTRPNLYARLMLWLLERMFGQTPDPMKVLAHHPMAMFGVSMNELAQQQSSRVAPNIKKLAQLQAARLVGCLW